MRPNPMRSTGFVILSLALHAAAFAAIMITPIRTVSDAGDRIEVSVGDPADKAGVKEAAATEAESKPEAVAPPEQPKAVAKEVASAPAPAPVPVPTPAPKKIVKATPKPAAPKPATAKAVAKAAPVKTAAPKVITQAVDPEDTTAPAAADETAPIADKAEDSKEEAPVLTPVKETAPAGVEAAADDVPEAKAEEKPVPVAAAAPVEKPTPAPAPAPKAEEAKPSAAPVAAAAAATTAAKGTSSKPAETGALAKGGSSKEGAVSYTSLKQMPGNRPPVYPLQARLENRQGNLELLYRVTKEGKVSDISIAKSSGSKDLDDSAVKAISQFKFYPGQEGWARHPVDFNLKGAVATLPSKLRANKNKTADADY